MDYFLLTVLCKLQTTECERPRTPSSTARQGTGEGDESSENQLGDPHCRSSPVQRWRGTGGGLTLRACGSPHCPAGAGRSLAGGVCRRPRTYSQVAQWGPGICEEPPRTAWGLPYFRVPARCRQESGSIHRLHRGLHERDQEQDRK